MHPTPPKQQSASLRTIACFIFALGIAGCGLSATQVEGLYTFTDNQLTESVRINRDSTYVQEIKIGNDVYTARGTFYYVDNGGILFKDMYRRFSNDDRREPLNPPQKASGVSTNWYRPGILRFIEYNKHWVENGKGKAARPFAASDTYYLTRQKEAN